MDKEENREARQIVEKIYAAFDRWQETGIRDENMREVYQDVEDILKEAEG